MRPVTLDIDLGVDDALAIPMAVHSPDLDLLGPPTTSGNMAMDQAIENTLKMLELVGLPAIPVYMGAAKPFADEPRYGFELHGPERLSAAKLVEPEAVPAGDAVDFLIAGIEARLGEVIMVATGSFPNLALAEAKPRAGGGAVDTGTCGRANNCTGKIAPARSPPLVINGQQLAAREGVLEAMPEVEFDQTVNLAAEAGRDPWTHPTGADVEPIAELEFDQTLGLKIRAAEMAHAAERE